MEFISRQRYDPIAPESGRDRASCEEAMTQGAVT
jgi:hypothetical protein